MTLRRILAGCWFGCDQTHARDDRGRLILRCIDCGSVTRLLDTPLVQGPQHQPAEVPGKPRTKTFTKGLERFEKRKAG